MYNSVAELRIMRRTFFLLLLCMFTFVMEVNADGIKWALYDTPATYEFHDGLAMYRENDLYGFCNTTGGIEIPARYKDAESFCFGSAVVKTETGFGIINRNGNYLLPPIYKEITRYDFYPAGCYQVKNADGEESVFYNNRLVIPFCKELGSVPFANFPFVEADGYVNIKTGDKFKNVVDYGDFFDAYDDGLGEHRYYDKSGSPLDAENLKYSHYGLYAYKADTGYWGFKNKNGNVVVEPTFYTIFPNVWYKDRMIVCSGNGDKLISGDGKILTTIETSFFNQFSNGYILVSSLESNGLIDLNGNKILEGVKELIPIVSDWFRYKKNNQPFVMNVKTGKEYPGSYSSLSDDMLRIKKVNGGTYYINALTGNVIDNGYEDGYDYSENVAVVEKNGTKMVIDKSGKVFLQGKDGLNITGIRFSEGVIDCYLMTDSRITSGYIYNPVQPSNYSYNQKATDKILKAWSKEGHDLLDKGNYTQAKELFYRVMMNDPTDSYAINNYGVCLDRMGNKEEALETFQMAYDLDRTNTTAKENIKILQEYFASQCEQAQVQTEERNNTFWNALASFGNLIGQMTGVFSNNNTQQMFADDVMSESNYGVGSSNSASYYKTQYSNWERRAEQNYNSITNLGMRAKNKQGDRSGSAMESMSGGNYTLMKKAFRDAQREMRNIRSKAARNGVSIPHSKWETATISY